MNRTTRLTLPALALTGALLLSACGGSNDTAGTAAPAPSSASHSMDMGGSPKASSGQHNDADMMFAQMMIVHHRGAIEMAKLAATNAGSGEVTALAAKIEAAQQPEIDLMGSWLTAWGARVPEGTSMDGMGMGGASMPGMMSGMQMTQLRQANGAAFDKLFLQMMTEHHQGAITMATDEQARGQDAAAVALAKKIVSDQTAEIAEMARMLTST